jgi:hypothetical protein
MEKKIRRLYAGDCCLVVSSIFFMWLVLAFIMSMIYSVVAGVDMRLLIVVVGLLTGIYGTAALVAVLVHLKRQQIEIYTEEIIRSCSSENETVK